MEKFLEELTKAIAQGPEFALEVFDRLLAPDSLRRKELLQHQSNFATAKAGFAAGDLDAGGYGMATAKVTSGLTGMLPLLALHDFVIPLSDAEKSGYQRQLELATAKMMKIQEALLLETDPSRSFAYEHQVTQLKQQISDLKSQLNAG